MPLKFRPIDNDAKLPKQIDQVKHWLDLLGLEHVVLIDPRDESYSFLLPIKNCPDIHIALDHKFFHISFFSNALTCLSRESEKKLSNFIRQILRVQSKYFTSRIVTTGPDEDLRVFLGYRFDEVSMYRFSRKIRELLQFVKEIADLIEKHHMKELWRDTEQEPKFPEIDISERVRFL